MEPVYSNADSLASVVDICAPVQHNGRRATRKKEER